MMLEKSLIAHHQRLWRWVLMALATVGLWGLPHVVMAQAVSCQVGVYDCAGAAYLSSGNVGIGTTAPQNTLDVEGHISLSSVTNEPRLRFLEHTSHAILAEVMLDQVTSNTGSMYFRTSEAGSVSTKLTISPAGKVGIGTISPAYPFHVVGDVLADAYRTTSDLRFKANIGPLDGALSKLGRIRGVTFDWNERYASVGRATGHREIGVIAQEVEAVFPEVVSRWGDEAYRAVDYGRLTAVLIEAVKELKAEQDAVEQALILRIDGLEKELQAQRAQLGLR